jgi:hypothetical protein
MTVADLERDVFGQPLRPIERAISGLLVVAGALGHAALALAALVLFYVVLFAV